MNLDWSDKYNTDIPEIDVQHKRFLSLIKKLYEEGDDKREKFILDEIYRYALFHFVSEEELMSIYSYSEKEKQKQSHQELISDLYTFINPIHGNKFNKEKILYFLIKWFVDHTTHEDKALGRFINSARAV